MTENQTITKIIKLVKSGVKISAIAKETGLSRNVLQNLVSRPPKTFKYWNSEKLVKYLKKFR